MQMEAEPALTAPNSDPSSDAFWRHSPGPLQPAPRLTDTTYTCSGEGCTLSPNTTYFVQAGLRPGYRALRLGLLGWHAASKSRHPGDNGWDLLNDHRYTGGSCGRLRRLSHLAEIVFENVPNPELTASDIGATTATLSIAHHTDERGTTRRHRSRHTTCEGPVAAGTSSKDITGLTAGTAYTYSAYSDSACSTLLATATGFTTLSSVSSLTSTRRTGTLESQIFTESDCWQSHSPPARTLAATSSRALPSPLKHTGGSPTNAE